MLAAMNKHLLLVPLLAGFLFLHDAYAQNYPRRGGGGQRGGDMNKGSSSDSESRHAPPSPQEPYGALERELLSLKVDIAIREDQLDAWRVFERDVKDVAEMERARSRHLMALRDMGDRPPSAQTFINSLVEDDRLKAEATAELKRHFEQLYAKLDDGQRRTLDRRTIQSQVEPLGSSIR
jgi:hypothetical protein